MKTKNKFKFKYPRFLNLILIYILVYIIFTKTNIFPIETFLSKIGYFGSFFSGIFYAYGFTAGPATAFFALLAKEQNILLCGLLGGLGSLVGDALIFRFIRTSFGKEIKYLSNEKIILAFVKILPRWLKKHLAIIIGMI
ncbi:MAG: hypothetical protein ACD_50C00381G0005, partial [uncultured bacterium]